MRKQKHRLSSLSHSIPFFLALVALAVFSPSHFAEAACVNTTTFDPNTKTTLYNMGGIDLGRAINIPPWVSPALFDGAAWFSQDVCTPVTAISTVTVLPTSYSFQVSNLGNAVKQSYLTRGNYQWNYDPVTGIDYPPHPICKPGNFCSGLSSLNEATCNGHDCRWNMDDMNGSGMADLNPWPYNVYIPEQMTNGYGLIIKGPSPLSVIKDQAPSAAAQVSAEDSVINGIASHGTIDLKVDTPSLSDSYTYHIPATNCVHLLGNGPRRIVFMRGKSLDSSTVSSFLDGVMAIINTGFANIEPLKTYFDQFSFYADLRKFDDTNIPTYPLFTVAGLYFPTIGFGDSIKSGSSCSTGTSNDGQGPFAADAYLFFFNKPNIYTAYAPMRKVGFFNIGSPLPPLGHAASPETVIHEFGHLLGYLQDEYGDSPYGSPMMMQLFVPVKFAWNCTLWPKSIYHSSLDNKIYGSVNAIGCGAIEAPRSPKDPDPKYWFRPSSDSIMKNQLALGSDRFNVIDCGYMVAGIKGEPVDKKHAEMHWPECLEMAKRGTVIMDGFPSPNLSTPTFTVPVNNTASPGFSVSLSGSNFTSTDNAVQFTNTATGAFYETLGIPSDGSTLSFLVPVDAPPGNYTMKVGAFNSDWSNSVPFTISQPITPVVSLSSSSLRPHALDPVTITWFAQGATSCLSGTTMTNPPAVWTTPDVSGSFTLSFPLASVGTTATFTMRCTGPGGVAENVVTITPTAPRPPNIVLSAVPQSLAAGSGTTVAWSTSRATSCAGRILCTTGAPCVNLPAWSVSQPTTGSLYLVPTVSTILTLSCTGPGGSSVSNLPITVTQPPSTPLSVSCSVTPQITVRHNELATYTATVTGGIGTYTYSWTGTDGLIGNGPQASMFYASSGAKTASVTVSSGNQSQTALCSSVQYNPSVEGPTVGSGNSGFQSLSPASGPSGTAVTIVGYPGTTNFVSGASTVVIRNGGATLYVRPTSIFQTALSNPPFSPISNLTFTFVPSLPLPTPSNGMTYSVSVMNNYASGLVEGGAQTFTLTGVNPLLRPSTASLTPTSGPVNTPVVLAGTMNGATDTSNFSSSTVVIIKSASTTDVVTPIFTPTAFYPTKAATLSFPFFPSFPTAGDYSVYTSNQGVLSTPVTFSLTAPTAPVIYLAIVRIPKESRVVAPSTLQSLWFLPKEIGVLWRTLAAAVLSVNVNSAVPSSSQTVMLTWSTMGATGCTGSTDTASVPGWGSDMALSGSLTVDPGTNQNFSLSCTGSAAVSGGVPVTVSKTVKVPAVSSTIVASQSPPSVPIQIETPVSPLPPQTPVAASSAFGRIITNIVNPLIYLLIGIAVIVFLWGAVEFVTKADDPEGRETGKRHLLWGIVGLVIIFGVYGIMNVIQGTLLSLFP